MSQRISGQTSLEYLLTLVIAVVVIAITIVFLTTTEKEVRDRNDWTISTNLGTILDPNEPAIIAGPTIEATELQNDKTKVVVRTRDLNPPAAPDAAEGDLLYWIGKYARRRMGGECYEIIDADYCDGRVCLILDGLAGSFSGSIFQIYHDLDRCRGGGSSPEDTGECQGNEVRDCPKQEGVCTGSKESCDDGHWSGCNYSSIPSYQEKEISCSDGLDNDCDNLTDSEEFACSNCSLIKDNLLENPCFEKGDVNWTVWSKDPEGQNARKGNASIFDFDGCFFGSCASMIRHDSQEQYLTQNVGLLEAGDYYVLSGLFKTDPNHYVKALLYPREHTGRDGCDLPTYLYRPGTGEWEQFSKVYHIPKACEGLTYSVIIYNNEALLNDSELLIDDVSLRKIDPRFSHEGIDEGGNWSLVCRSFTNDSYYKVVPCDDKVITKSGGSTILRGNPRQMIDLYLELPIESPAFYDVGLSLKISDRKVYNYLDLGYPDEYTINKPGTRDIVEQTKGIWSGRYSLTLDDTSYLNPQAKDKPYRSAPELDWFREESSYTSLSGKHILSIRLRLTGIDGKVHLDDFDILKTESIIDDEIFEIPIYENDLGMSFETSSSPLGAILKKTAIELSGDRIIAKDREGNHIASISFEKGFLSALKTEELPGALILENENAKFSITADSLVLFKLKKGSEISVEIPKAYEYENYEAGQIFVSDNEKGFYFAEIMSPNIYKLFPLSYDPATNSISYSDGDFASVGLKNWKLRTTDTSTVVEYDLKHSSGFFFNPFPPKEFDYAAYCKKRVGVGVGDLEDTGDFDTFLKERQKSNHYLLWIDKYLFTENPGAPETYCYTYPNKRSSKTSERIYVYCEDGDGAQPGIHKGDVGYPFDISGGKYDVRSPSRFRSYISKAHEKGIKVFGYISPNYYYTSDVDLLLDNVAYLVGSLGLDGVYYDGLYLREPIKSLELVRKTRNLLGERFYLQHNSINKYTHNHETRYRVPFLDAYADLLWLGEGVSSVDEASWKNYYCGRNVSNTPSVTLNEYRPVNYLLDFTDFKANSMTGEEQILRLSQCDGLFRESAYTEEHYLRDNVKFDYANLDYKSYYNASLMRDLWNERCLPYTCPDGICDIGEDETSCPLDCPI